MVDHPFTDTDFRKSDRSGDVGCVEVALTRHTPDTVGLRDSVHPRGVVLCLSTREWAVFAAGVGASG